MSFPFNLLSIDWSALTDARGAPAALVPEWLAGLADDLPLVREEAFDQLEEALGEGAGAAAHAVEPLLKLIEAEGRKGRALAALLLANLAQQPRSTEVVEQLREERASLETLTTRHAASTPFGAALRALTTVLSSPPGTRFVEQLAAVEALVLEADGKDEAPPPTPAQVKEWAVKVARGEGHALGLAQRAFGVDPAGALAILEADTKPAATSLQRVHRVVLEAKCHEALGKAVAIAPGDWSRTAQALLLDAAERASAQVGAALLTLVSDPSHAVRRRAVEVKVRHAAGARAEAAKLADALAAEWLMPARAGAVNQVLGKGELIALLTLCGGGARLAQVQAAPVPEVALPDGDVL